MVLAARAAMNQFQTWCPSAETRVMQACIGQDGGVRVHVQRGEATRHGSEERASGHMNRPYSEEETVWLAAHAHEGTRDSITMRFNTRFDSARSEKGIARHARESGHPVRPMRSGRRYTAEQKRWIKDNAPSIDCAELARRFNTRFADDVTPGQIQSMAATLGTPTRPRPPTPRTSWGCEEIEWLKANAKTFSARAAGEEILKKFGKDRNASAMSAIAKRYGLKFASGSLRTPHEVHEVQRAWLNEEVPKHENWDAVTQAFNDRFGTTLATKTLRPRATKLGVRPRAVVPPGESALTTDQRAWLHEQADKCSWDETIRAFNERFAKARSKTWLQRHARRVGIECLDGRGKNRARARRWRPDQETRAWLIAQAPSNTNPQLLGLIKVRYNIEISGSTLRVRLNELGVSAKKTTRATPRSAEALAWLEDNAGEYGCTELATRYEDEFGVRVSAGALKEACQGLEVRIRTETGGRHHWGSSERAWLRTQAHRMHFEALRTAFNKRFDASVSKDSLKGQLKSLGERAKRPPKWFSWGETELEWVTRHAPQCETRGLCKAFNERFDAAIRPASMRARLAQLGMKPKPTSKRTLSAHERAWIAERIDECSNSDLARRFNKQFAANIYPSRIPLEARRARDAASAAR